MNDIARCLAEHRFRDLFIETLGWDHASGNVEIPVDGEGFRLTIIAQKRGLQVLHGTSEQFQLIDRGFLRRVQRKLAALIHEHVAIYSCDSPRKQVWQWAVRREDGHRLRHREHPFFSNLPPSRLLERLKVLRFAIEDEDELTVFDALDRVRTALDHDADVNLFVNKPWYARRSDELARAARNGGAAELDELLSFHKCLVPWVVKSFAGHSGAAVEDLEQIGVMGLIHAARNFDPTRGVQFSTYAIRCVRGYCRRATGANVSILHVPLHAVWPCLKLRKTLSSLLTVDGENAIRRYLDELTIRDPKRAREWSDFSIATNTRSLSCRGEPEYRQARAIPATNTNPGQRLARAERTIVVRQLIALLPARDAAIVRMRFGFDGREYTLREIGEEVGLTRERVRQLIVDICSRLGLQLESCVGTTRRDGVQSKSDSDVKQETSCYSNASPTTQPKEDVQRSSNAGLERTPIAPLPPSEIFVALVDAYWESFVPPDALEL